MVNTATADSSSDYQFIDVVLVPEARPEDCWFVSPEFTNVLQRELGVKSSDIGKYVVAIQFEENYDAYFVTPATVDSGELCCHGLNGCTYLSEAFSLFESPALAGERIAKWKRYSSALYRVDVIKNQCVFMLIGQE